MDECAEYVGGGRSGVARCTYPPKGERDGKPLCGVHLRAFDQRIARRRQYEAKRAQDREQEERAARAVRVLATLGIKAKPYYKTLGPPSQCGYTGEVVVDSDDLLGLLSAGRGTMVGVVTPRNFGEMLEQSAAGTLDYDDPVVQHNLRCLEAGMDRAHRASQRPSDHDDGSGRRP